MVDYFAMCTKAMLATIFGAPKSVPKPGCPGSAAQILFNGALIGKSLVLSHSVIQGGVFCQPKQGFRTEVRGEVRLLDAQVSGDADFSCSNISTNFLLVGASIQGVLCCLSAKAIDFQVGEDLDLSGCQVREAQIDLHFLTDRLPMKLEGFQFKGLKVQPPMTITAGCWIAVNRSAKAVTSALRNGYATREGQTTLIRSIWRWSIEIARS